MLDNDDIEFDDETSEALEDDKSAQFYEAVLFSSDWTVETILSQLKRDNIQLNPNFQRREAWNTARKSKFIETVIVGLPAPQLVLAEVKGQRGKYIVLDGKQRLLTLLRFTESADNREQGFGLSGLEIRSDLLRKKFFHINNDVELRNDLDSFLNYTIRTVIIRNWPNNDFLHQVFLRLNTGSVKLSSQELRQAMAPGAFTTFADDFSANSEMIQVLLGRKTPDPRMRDVELLVRHIAFKTRLTDYKGRMKRFLDETCAYENDQWVRNETNIRQHAHEFEEAIRSLVAIFGNRVARKSNSVSFNRAIFDALAFYAAQPDIRTLMEQRPEDVLAAYTAVIARDDFKDAVERDTAGLSNTVARVRIWGEALQQIFQTTLRVPLNNDGQIEFEEI